MCGLKLEFELDKKRSEEKKCARAVTQIDYLLHLVRIIEAEETVCPHFVGFKDDNCECVCVCVLHIKPFFYSSTSSTPSVRTDSSP